VWRRVVTRAGRRIEVGGDHNVIARVSRGTVGQVLDVLLENALEHGRGTIRVDVTRDGRAAVISVADDGPGVPEADRERIFERGASRAGRTGIGLHLARTLAEGDGGAIRVSSAGASRFELRLPAAERLP
jgi:signal transduction histidine kinase